MDNLDRFFSFGFSMGLILTGITTAMIKNFEKFNINFHGMSEIFYIYNIILGLLIMIFIFLYPRNNKVKA